MTTLRQGEPILPDEHGEGLRDFVGARPPRRGCDPVRSTELQRCQTGSGPTPGCSASKRSSSTTTGRPQDASRDRARRRGRPPPRADSRKPLVKRGCSGLAPATAAGNVGEAVRRDAPARSRSSTNAPLFWRRAGDRSHLSARSGSWCAVTCSRRPPPSSSSPLYSPAVPGSRRVRLRPQLECRPPGSRGVL